MPDVVHALDGVAAGERALGKRACKAVLVEVRHEDRGSIALEDGREVIDVYRPSSAEPSTTIDPDCNRIDTIIPTSWGFVAQCLQVSPDAARASHLRFISKYYLRSV